MDKKIIEGKGVEPNETIHLDWQSHQATGKDKHPFLCRMTCCDD